ncbi:HEAT repeat domain-containing protein [Candidatus Poribacteria bacterium]|nr:HEAT repeat domain-containing protein [Candidatus Poribacteria bacterium]
MLSFEQLLQNLTDTTQPNLVRSTAIAGIVAQYGSQGVKFLVEALNDADAVIRREAAKALQDLNATSAIEPLLHALQTESNDITLWAMLEAISELGSPSVLPVLESLSNVDSMLTRIEIKKSISRIQTRHADEAAQIDASNHTPIEKTEETATNEASIDKRPNISIELTSANPLTDPTQDTIDTATVSEKPTETENKVQTTDQSGEIISETEPTETEDAVTNLLTDPDERVPTDSEDTVEPIDDTQFAEAAVETIDEGEDTETVAADAESPQPEENTDIKDLSETIAQSPRLAGSSVNLPMLAPNAATVPYHATETSLEPTHANFFLTLLHPSKHFSKQWVSRTRAYLILWAVLIAAVVGFTQHQKHFRAETTSLFSIGLSAGELPELVKRSLAEGDFYIQEGLYRKAISSYELSRRLDVLPLSFYRKLGFAYFKEGQYALAVEAYELFLEARNNGTPDVFAAEASLSDVYPLTSVEEQIARDYETYNILGMAYAKLGRVLDAQRAYRQAIRMAPKYGEAYNNLARLYADNHQQLLAADLGNPTISQKLRLAEALAYTAVTLNPDVAAYHDTLGWILSKRGQVNKAIKTLERAIDLQKDAVEPHYHLAQVALEVKDRKKAVKAIRNVFKLQPAFVSLKTGE